MEAGMNSNPATNDKGAGTLGRREFLRVAGGTAATVLAVGPSVHSQDKSGSRTAVIGTGEFKYSCIHGWGTPPKHVQWGETHGVCVDAAGLIYIKHRSDAKAPMDAIVVFDPDGKCIRSFGTEYHHGGHGIDLRREDGVEYLYLSDIHNRQVVKTTLTGEHVWEKSFPKEPGVYRDISGYRPTNVAFAPDGGFYIGDGYGSHYIHQYDRDARWVRTWGGFGKEPGKMSTPHGLWLDDRPGREPALVVADRANARLQYFTLNGKHLSFVHDVSFPAHFDIRSDVLLVPDLHARVTLFDKDNRVIVHLGYDPEWTKAVLADGFKMRSQPDRWQPGKFIHPHDACFDRAGNIFVVEWVPTGRVTKLVRVG
jgi:hypothetical protein